MSRMFTSRRRGPIWVRVVIVVALVGIAAWRARVDGDRRGGQVVPNANPAAVEREGQTRRVERVVDGDTLLLVGGERVRLIGVDTPESVKPEAPVEPWGPEASAFTERFVADGPVRLEFDQERRDDFGRTLAYVYAGSPESGAEEMLNEALIREGLGRAMLRHPYSEGMKDRFHRAQQEAQREKRGIWSGTK